MLNVLPVPWGEVRREQEISRKRTLPLNPEKAAQPGEHQSDNSDPASALPLGSSLNLTQASSPLTWDEWGLELE